MALISDHLLNGTNKKIVEKKSFEEMNWKKKLKREEQTFHIKIRGEKYFFFSSIYMRKNELKWDPHIINLTTKIKLTGIISKE